MKIYTKKGDQGKTSLLGGVRVSKTDSRVKTYGSVDELQSHLGMARILVEEKSISEMVFTIQQTLLTAGAELSATPEASRKLTQRITSENIFWLEEQIDALTASYGLPHTFVIPGESLDSATLHVARSVCRRCERLILMLAEQNQDKSPQNQLALSTILPNDQIQQSKYENPYDVLLQYFNRLSDLLFTMAWALQVRALVKRIIRNVLEELLKGKHP